MGKLGTSRFNLGLTSLFIGVALTTLARLTHGFVGGLLIGAGLTLIVASAYAMGRQMRGARGWLPSRDGQPGASTHRADDR